jgi:hypothetical protein
VSDMLQWRGSLGVFTRCTNSTNFAAPSFTSYGGVDPAMIPKCWQQAPRSPYSVCRGDGWAWPTVLARLLYCMIGSSHHEAEEFGPINS